MTDFSEDVRAGAEGSTADIPKIDNLGSPWYRLIRRAGR